MHVELFLLVLGISLDKKQVENGRLKANLKIKVVTIETSLINHEDWIKIVIGKANNFSRINYDFYKNYDFDS